MLTLTWSEEVHGTGVPEVDEQHKKLFQMVNHLLDATLQGKRKDEIVGMISFLEAYTLEHFAFEEKCMAELKCSIAEKNKQEHDLFVADVAKLKAKVEADGVNEMVGVLLTAKVVHWLQYHVSIIDTNLRHTQSSGI